MNLLTDLTIIGPVLNIINTVTNLIWTNRLKSVQGNKELIAALREANEDKDQVIKNLTFKKNQYKEQYKSLLHKYGLLEGEVNACKRVHPQSLVEPQK